MNGRATELVLCFANKFIKSVRPELVEGLPAESFMVPSATAPEDKRQAHHERLIFMAVTYETQH